MKKSALLVLIICISVLIAGIAYAGVAGSKHDFSSLTGGGNFQAAPGSEDEICIFCHTPHGGQSRDWAGNSIPLWNKSGVDTTPTFSLYDSPTFNSKSNITQPTGVSLLCLSCHDGVSTLNGLINYGRFNPIVMVGGFDQIEDVWTPGFPGYPGANIGESASRNLSNDHPVSFDYNLPLLLDDAALRDPSTIAPLKLFNGKLECATCHDPHEEGDLSAGTYPFLRKSNQGSEMCLTCHIK